MKLTNTNNSIDLRIYVFGDNYYRIQIQENVNTQLLKDKNSNVLLIGNCFIIIQTKNKQNVIICHK